MGQTLEIFALSITALLTCGAVLFAVFAISVSGFKPKHGTYLKGPKDD